MQLTKIRGASLMFGLCFLLMGCRSLRLISSPYKDSELNQTDNVGFRTGESTYSHGTQKMSVEVTNYTQNEISYGIGYSLEKEEGQWMEIVPLIESSIKEIGIVLKSGEDGSDTIDLSTYPVLTGGTYRIIRNIGGDAYSANFSIE